MILQECVEQLTSQEEPAGIMLGTTNSNVDAV